jgi:hypothetical protein
VSTLIGNPTEFAIEASLGEDENAVFGNFRLWIGGSAVGNWEKRVLLTACMSEARHLARKQSRFHETLSAASADEVFREVFDPFVSDFWNVPRSPYESRFDRDYSVVDRFWMNPEVSSLDEYAILFLKDSKGRERLLWAHSDVDEVHEHRVHPEQVEDVVRQFVDRFSPLLESTQRSVVTHADSPTAVLSGKKDVFAIEAIVRQRCDAQYFGGFRFWIGGQAFGDWDDMTYLLGCYSGLTSLLKPTQRFDSRLHGLAPADIFLAVGAPPLTSEREVRRPLFANMFETPWCARHRFDITYAGMSSFENLILLLLTDATKRDYLLCYDHTSDKVSDTLLDEGLVRRVIIDFLKLFRRALSDFS